MRNVMMLVVMSLSLVACGAKKGVQDPAVVEYVQRYESTFGRDVSSQTITMVDKIENTSAPGTVGVCFSGADEIHILRSYWDKASDLQKQMVVFHELGHCDMHEEHRVGLQPDNCANSIMYPYTLSDTCYTEHMSDYLKELIANRKN